MNIGIGIYILLIYIISIVYIHYRGQIRYGPIRQMMTHTNLIAPYNALVYVTSLVPNKPILKIDEFPELRTLRDNWQTIRDEALALADQGHISSSTAINDLGFNSFFRTGWKRFYLKWYDDFHPSAVDFCPKTVAILKSTPSVSAAMFTSLPPGAKLSAHRDPFAGSVRYHLGLKTPNDDRCLINIDGINYSWRDGDDILFDETYIHYASNDTDQQRIILFCDVQRPLRFKIANKINRFISNKFIKLSTTQNIPGEHIGFLNRVFGHFYKLRLGAKKIKKWNRPIYKTLKFALFFSLIYLIFL